MLRALLLRDTVSCDAETGSAVLTGLNIILHFAVWRESIVSAMCDTFIQIEMEPENRKSEDVRRFPLDTGLEA